MHIYENVSMNSKSPVEVYLFSVLFRFVIEKEATIHGGQDSSLRVLKRKLNQVRYLLLGWVVREGELIERKGLGR
jgi:hypothetical protein